MKQPDIYESNRRAWNAEAEAGNFWTVPVSQKEIDAKNKFEVLVTKSSNKEEIGYIIVGSIEEGYSHYMLEWDTSLLRMIRQYLKNNQKAKTVYYPPLDFAFRLESSDGVSIMALDQQRGISCDVTKSIIQNSKRYYDSYSSILKNGDRFAIRNQIQVVESSKSQTDCDPHSIVGLSSESKTQSKTTKEDIRIKKEYSSPPQFISIVANSTLPYGGDQNWYSSDILKKRGCGPVAAANILAYMSLQKSEYSKLYTETSYSQANFTQFMNKLYLHLQPGLVGTPDKNQWIEKVKSWASSKGITLTAHSYPATYDKYSAAYAIKQGLKNDHPVASLNLNYGFSMDGETYGWHWVTITKYFQSVNDNRWIAVSSWGERKSLNWDVYWAGNHDHLLASDSGYIYFD